MEKLKNFLSPGKAADDEILYGSGRSNDNVHSGNTGTLSGEGSHFDNSQDTPSGLGLGSSNIGNAPTTAGPHSTDLANKMDPRVDSDLDGSRTVGNSTGDYGYSGRSTMPGAFESDSNPYSAQELDPRLGGPTTASGVGSSTYGTEYGAPSQQTGYASRRTAGAPGTYDDNTGIGNTSSNTTTGPHRSNLLNKLDPRVDSNASRDVNNPSSDTHYGRDAAAIGGAAVVGEGIHHRQNERDNLDTSGYSGTTPSGTGSAYYGGPTGTAVSGVSGPHATSTANRLDPTVNTSGRSLEDARLHDPQTGGGGVAADEAHSGSRHHIGRDAAVGAGAVGLAEHEHRKHEREREMGAGGTTGYGSNTGAYGDNAAYDNTTGTAGPHKSSLLNKLDPRVDSSTGSTGNTGTGTGHHYGRDAAIGAGGVGLAEHEHRKYEREQEAGFGRDTGIGSNTAYGDNSAYDNTTGTAGPHKSSLLNKLDPRVDSTTGSTSNAGTGTGASHHYGRDAAVGAGVVGVAEHEHRKHEREREYERDTGLGNTTGVRSNTGDYRDNSAYDNTTGTTTGPHKSSLLNKLDPRVDSTTGTMENTGTGSGSGSGHHYGRDAAIGAGGVGLAEHEHRKHEREREYERDSGLGNTTGTVAYRDNSAYDNTAGTTTGPHNSSLLNKLDPRVDSTSGTSDNTRSEHHYGRDAAIGAGGVGLAEHEHRKHEREREREAGVGVTTGIGSNTGTYGGNPAYDSTTGTTAGPHKSSLLNKLDPRVDSTGGTMDNTRSGPHYGRDAAIGAGGIGLAEHEHQKHERERDAGIGSNTGVGANTGTYGDNSAYDNTTGTTAGPHKSSLLNKLDPRVDSTSGTMDNTRSDHHYGRDAAIGAGGIGLAEHEHREHEREREAGVGPNTGIGSTTGNYRNDPTYADTTGTSGHHYGRDAAIGGGALGLAEHEHRKHERERESDLNRGTGAAAATTSGTGPAPNTAGPHSQDWMNRLDPRVDSNPDKANTGLSGNRGTTHTGRDAVVGAGLVGAAGYEAEKHHAARNNPGTGGTYDEGLPDFHHTGRDASAAGAATALDENEKARLRAARGERDNTYNQGPVEPGYGSTTTGTATGSGPYDPGYNPNTTGPMHEQTRDHHLGRDAAVAGVAGGAAYEAEKHHRHDKDLTAAEREQKRELKYEEKEARREQKEEKKHHGFLSFLHRDKNKKYTKEEEEEFDRQERDHHGHVGRDAAIGGAAVGGTAYEAERHHGHQHTSSGEPDTMKPLPIAPGNHGIGTGEGTQNALMMDRKRGVGYDTDPTTGTGQPLAAGSDDYQPPGTTIGDKLHGIERNRGVNDGTTGTAYDDTTGNAGASSGIGYGTNDPATTMSGANTQSERSAGYAAPTAAKPNVLHKDPPPNHPAARAMAGQGTYPEDTTGPRNY